MSVVKLHSKGHELENVGERSLGRVMELEILDELVKKAYIPCWTASMPVSRRPELYTLCTFSQEFA